MHILVFKRRLCDSSPKLEDIRDPALVEGGLRPQADAGQVEVPGGELAIQVQSVNLWVFFVSCKCVWEASLFN